MAISIESILSQLKKVKKSGNGWIACCPAHNDQYPSLKISTGNDGKVLLHCKASCTVEQICKALEISVKDLFPANPRQTTQAKHVLTLEELAQAKAIPMEFLKKLGVSQVKNGIVIPYYDIDETPQRQRKRTALIAKEGSLWEGEGKIIPYGLWLLEEKDIIALPDNGILIVEGESDVWTTRLNGFQALGIPGAQMINVLQLEHIQKFPTVYIVKESDQGGEVFLQGMTARLKQIGYHSKVKVILMPGNGIKDINDLWRKEPEDVKFWNAILGLAEKAQEISFREESQQKPQSQLVEPKTKKPAFPQIVPVIKTLSSLLETKFPPRRWIVENLLAIGTTLLSGSPKIGKSFLALNIALAVAHGGTALGKIKVEQGQVLYLDLEEDEQDLQERAQALLAEGGHTENFFYATEWPKFNEGGLEALENWLKEHPKARLVIIDTLVKIRPFQSSKKSLYEQDYWSVQGLVKLASAYHIAILIIHHNRKGDSDDFLQLISGSFGLSGGVANALVLKKERGKADAVLYTTGKKLKDTEIAMEFKYPNWTMLGDAQQFRISQERQNIIAVLKGMGRAMTPKEVTEALQMHGLSCNSVQPLLYKMSCEGTIKQINYGKYQV